jgi:hypothetical protein
MSGNDLSILGTVNAIALFPAFMPIPQIVIDTNIIVAGIRSRNGSAFRLLTLVGTGRFDIHLSVPLVLEYEEVLFYGRSEHRHEYN